MKLLNRLAALTILFALSNANAQWTSPDEKSPSCAATPAELAQKADTLARVNAITSSNGKVGLEAAFGAWKYSSVFGKMTVSVSYDDKGFYLQSDDDVPEAASLCADDNNPSWVRISVHSPACPENKNIYIKAMEVDTIGVKAYMSRSLGGVKFKKIADQPLPPGSPKEAPKCDELVIMGDYEFAPIEY